MNFIRSEGCGPGEKSPKTHVRWASHNFDLAAKLMYATFRGIGFHLRSPCSIVEHAGIPVCSLMNSFRLERTGGTFGCDKFSEIATALFQSLAGLRSRTGIPNPQESETIGALMDDLNSEAGRLQSESKLTLT